jgi:multicomponent Na+:H+ antiporter subunit D
MQVYLPTLILVPLGAAFLMLLLDKVNRRLPAIVSNLAALYLLIITIYLYAFRPFNKVLVYKIGGWGTPLGLNLVLDGFSHLLLLIISLAALLVTFYSISYMEQYTGQAKYYALLLLVIAGMIGTVLTGDLFNLFIFWEVASLASIVLVAFGVAAEELEAAMKYALLGTVATVLVVWGIALTYSLTGTLSLAEIARHFPQNAVAMKTLITLLFLVGFGTKAALVPFHAWLPDAHPAAPAPVSATLSGVLIKALGVYALVRIFYNVIGLTPLLAQIFVLLGIISVLVGAWLAAGQRDLKRLLAYSSISQIGYIIVGFGLATPLSIMGALFHLFNHALIKPLLFMNAGAVEYAAGTRELPKLGGLSRVMPVTAQTSLVGSFALSGLPPFNGFWSKLFIILACVQAGRWGLALLLVLGSILTLAYFARLQKRVFFSQLPAALSKVAEVPWPMATVMIVMALGCLLGGLFFPYLLGQFINPAVIAVMNGTGYGRLVGGL